MILRFFCTAALAGVLLLPALAQEDPPPPPAAPAPPMLKLRVAQKAVEGAKKEQVQAAIVDAPVAANLNLPPVPDQLIQQYEQQLRPVLRGHLHLARAACDLTGEEWRRFSEAGDRVLRQAAERIAKRHQGGIGPNDPQLEPIEFLARALVEAAEDILPPERSSRLREEIEASEEARKHAAAGVLVATVDRMVLLTPEQRERLRRELMARWEDSWYQSAEMLQQNARYLPRLPEEGMAAVLDEAQMRIWRGRSRSTVTFGGVFFGQSIDNAALDAPEPIEGRDAAPDPRP